MLGCRGIAAIFLAAGALLASGAFSAAGEGTSAPLGRGTVRSFALLGAQNEPLEIGILFSKDAFEDLPADPNGTSRCFDLDESGTIDESGECEGDYQVDLQLPPELGGREDIPFVWSMVNWNPRGHGPEAWSVPHFDIHFYQVSPAAVAAIRLGRCGFFIHCEDFTRAVKPVDPKYVHADHVNVQAAVGAMGNHLIDGRTPELGNPPQPFTHTWIFGAYDGEIIFHEVMVTRDFLMATAESCAPVKQPAAWRKAGYYPTRYCFRQEPSDGSLRVFMTDFVKRPAG